MRTPFAIAVVVCLAGPVLWDGAGAQSARRADLMVTNPTADARPAETITLTAADLQRVLEARNLQLVHIRLVAAP